MSNAEPAIYFAAIVAGMVLDLLASVAAPRFYWNTTFPVLKRSYKSLGKLSFDSLAAIKEENRGWTVRWLANENQEFRIGFRERFWGLTSFYTPILHGELVSSPGKLVLVGRIGWFHILFSVVFLRIAWEFRAPEFFVALVAITAILVFIQRVRFENFARRCQSLASDGVKNA